MESFLPRWSWEGPSLSFPDEKALLPPAAARSMPNRSELMRYRGV